MSFQGNKNDNSRSSTTIIIKRDSNALGIASFVFGLISIFILAPVFVPLAIFIGGIAIIKKQFAWGIIGLVCALIGFFTSPILLGLVGMIAIGTAFQSETSNGNLQTPSSFQLPSATGEHVMGKSLDKVPSKNPRDSIRRDFKVGPLFITAYGKCSPLMSECENKAVLHYDNQTLNIDSTGSSSHPIAETEASWVSNRFVTINYANGGNCWACEGIDVAAFEDGKLFYLGKFSRFEDAYLIKPYDVLENNALTSHAGAPSWKLYFRYAKGKAILDTSKTCLVAKARYDRDKNDLLSLLSIRRKDDESSVAEQTPWWLENNVKEPLLGTMAVARYCGWQNDYEAIIKAARTSNSLVTYEMLQKLSNELGKVQLAEIIL
jgi:hypothetical protein